MSTRGAKRPVKGNVRDSRKRKMPLDVDLNVSPPGENRACEEISAGVGPSVQGSAALHPLAIDVEAIDDEVVIASPRRFAEARNNNSRRNNRVTVTVIVDEDSAVRQGHSDESLTRLALNNKRRSVPANQVINLEDSLSVKKNNVPKFPEPPTRSIPPPKEPTFSCPVCMGPLVEEMSTKCGHIFCKTCIKAAIGAQSKCPTCRRKLTMKDTIRVYLPTTS